MPNGRCNLHGGRSGRPIIHGKRSQYVRLFGEQFAQLLADPDLLRSDTELALYDRFLLERAALLSDGFSGQWLLQVQEASQALQQAFFEEEDLAGARAAFDDLSSLVASGGERVAAWEEMLAAAKDRSSLASKAATALARQEQTVTQGQMVVLFGQMLRILVDVAGADTAGRVKDRFERECLGRLATGSREPAGAPTALH